jgi:hypothetical protein
VPLVARHESESTPVGRRAQGAYGLRFDGVAHELLVEAPQKWERWHVRRAFAWGDAPAPEPRIGEWRAVLGLRPAGELVIDRRRQTAKYATPEPLGDEALLPYLDPLAAVAAIWAGRLPLAGGAFLDSGGAWAVLGAAADELPLPRMATTLLVIDGGTVLAGPGGIHAEAPLLGFVHARFRGPGDVPPGQRLAALTHALAIKTRAHDASALVALAELPMLGRDSL